MGSDEHSAERKFDKHMSKGKRDINELPLHLLKELASVNITEKEAWKLAKS